ncbi:MAG: Sulfite oxidase-like oxidoreductase, molybdopterin-binding subunit [Acidimicrobiia bacterium]|nr:Sulfite oxidase-like oxidoreductase, molybdopterin-binding subunit [Acidimicrobiia bacterium]
MIDSPELTSAVDVPPAAGVGWPWAAVSGVLAAATGLAITELITTPGGRTPSVVSSVAARLIDNTPGWLVRFGIDRLGTNDKPVLVVSIVALCLVAGAVCGLLGARRRWWGVAATVAVSMAGLSLALGDQLAPRGRLWTASILGALASVAALLMLLATLDRPGEPAAMIAGPVRAQDPRIKLASRRQFFAYAGGTGAVAVTAVGIGKALRGSSSADSASQVVLPAPARAALSASPTESFDVAGLSPLVTPNADFYRIDTAVFIPRVDVNSWKLKISGMVDHPFELNFNELLAMDLVEETVTMQCVSNAVGGDLVGNAVWRGVPLKGLLERAGVQPKGVQIVGRSVDGFTAGFPTEKALDGRVAMLVVGMNGQPLPAVHGFPARLVVAGLYGYVSATKWLSEIQLTDWDFDGYWVPRGWAKEGPIKTQSRIDVPRDGAKLPVGKVTVAGVAWAPTRGISKVEVRIDDGDWVEARIGDATDKNTWVQWMVDWDATAGKHYVWVRATDGTGAVQIEKQSSPDPDGATGYHWRRVTVA